MKLTNNNSNNNAFSPEQEKAYAVLKECLPSYQQYLVDSLPPKPLETNYRAFSKRVILKENLPHESWWVWNQSNAKVERWLNENIKVTIQKFNPRKRAGYREKKASYKLWLYSLSNKSLEHQLSFVWCEKGVSNSSLNFEAFEPFECSSMDVDMMDYDYTDAEISFLDMLNGEDVTLQSLSFLKTFVSPKVAAEFGW